MKKTERRANKLAKALQTRLGCNLEDALIHADTIIKYEEAYGK